LKKDKKEAETKKSALETEKNNTNNTPERKTEIEKEIFFRL